MLFTKDKLIASKFFYLQFVTTSVSFVTAVFRLSQFIVRLSQSKRRIVCVRNQVFIFAAVSHLTNAEFRKSQLFTNKYNIVCQTQEYHKRLLVFIRM